VEGRANRLYPHHRRARRMNLDRRANPARRSSRFQIQSLRSGVSSVAEEVRNWKALCANRPLSPLYPVALEGLRRLLPEPTPSPRLCIDRPGATPSGLVHPITPSRQIPVEQDISTGQRIGHFYLALTAGHNETP
jgi:hypothetical protein